MYISDGDTSVGSELKPASDGGEEGEGAGGGGEEREKAEEGGKSGEVGMEEEVEEATARDEEPLQLKV